MAGVAARSQAPVEAHFPFLRLRAPGETVGPAISRDLEHAGSLWPALAGERLFITGGLRGDLYRFRTRALDGIDVWSGAVTDGIFSPKIGANYEIVDGIDELGVLLYGHKKNAYWYGSQLSIDETREIAPYQNATGLQVTSAVLAGMVWALENPNEGIVEADEMDFRRCLEVQMPYLGPVIGTYTDWTPLTGRPGLFPEDLDKRDPWQFRNVLVR